ncbi:MAG: hypothetical protein VX278_13715 [Myxococcota bacterium]|nr:hypothetical protein [Myxococcota bacterium]
MSTPSPFWNWFFHFFVQDAPVLPNLGHFSRLQPEVFALQPAGRFAASLERSFTQRIPPPSYQHRWGGLRNPQSILKWMAFVQAGGSIETGSAFEQWALAYHQHIEQPILQASQIVQRAIVHLGDNLLVHHKAQLSSHIRAKVVLGSPEQTNRTPTFVRSVHLSSAPSPWRIEIHMSL